MSAFICDGILLNFHSSKYAKVCKAADELQEKWLVISLVVSCGFSLTAPASPPCPLHRHSFAQEEQRRKITSLTEEIVPCVLTGNEAGFGLKESS